MPIPPLDSDGLLPPGIHEASLDDVTDYFGGMNSGQQRRMLIASLRSYVKDVTPWGMATELIIDGSFVTDATAPNDIDLVLVLRTDYDFGQPVSPFEYNLRSHRMVKRQFGFDLFAALPGSKEYDAFVDLFSQVRNRPGLRKGLIRVRL